MFISKTSPQAKRHKTSLLFTSMSILTSLALINFYYPLKGKKQYKYIYKVLQKVQSNYIAFVDNFSHQVAPLLLVIILARVTPTNSSLVIFTTISFYLSISTSVTSSATLSTSMFTIMLATLSTSMSISPITTSSIVSISITNCQSHQ